MEQLMDWQRQLIWLYVEICRLYKQELWQHCQRFSNNCLPEFTDEEVMTIYIFGVMEHRTTVKDIHRHVKNHLLAWFPKLPQYEAFNARLTFLCAAFEHLLPLLESRIPYSEVIANVRLIDSMPVIVARGSRSATAKVAPEICDKGYCSSKDLHYYGVKLHAIGLKRFELMPRVEHIIFTPASQHDVLELRTQAGYWGACDVYGDKGYFYHYLGEHLPDTKVVVYTPFQRVRNSPPLNEAQVLWNTSVSRVRQPIECFFNWLQEKTNIQNASKVRSSKGLLVHLLGKIAAALAILILNP